MSKAASRVSEINTQGMGRQIKRAQTHCSFAADTNSFTLSRQRENIAALGVVWLGLQWVFDSVIAE
jgi:hypothetical protein